jgi:hypothetical protein
VNEDYRIFHQFLYKEGWIQHIDGRQHEPLINIVSFSTLDPIYGPVHKHIAKFLTDTQDGNQSYYTRRLISTRPAEEHDNTQVRHHRSVNPPTIRTYARVISGLISFLHRVSSPENHLYTLTIAPQLLSMIQALISLLGSEPVSIREEDQQQEATDTERMDAYESEDDSDVGEAGPESEPPARHSTSHVQSSSVQDNVFTLLYQLYTQLPSVENRGQFSNPIIHYLVLSSLRKGQEWAQSSTITQTIAALLFAGRLVFARKMNDIVQHDGCTTNQ